MPETNLKWTGGYNSHLGINGKTSTDEQILAAIQKASIEKRNGDFVLPTDIGPSCSKDQSLVRRLHKMVGQGLLICNPGTRPRFGIDDFEETMKEITSTLKKCGFSIFAVGDADREDPVIQLEIYHLPPEKLTLLIQVVGLFNFNHQEDMWKFTPHHERMTHKDTIGEMLLDLEPVRGISRKFLKHFSMMLQKLEA